MWIILMPGNDILHCHGNYKTTGTLGRRRELEIQLAFRRGREPYVPTKSSRSVLSRQRVEPQRQNFRSSLLLFGPDRS